MFGLLRRMPGYRLMIIILVLLGFGAGAMLSLRGCEGGYEIDPAERWVVERATEDAAERLSATLPMRKVLLMPLAGDDDGYITMKLTDGLEDIGDFEVYQKADLGTLESALASIASFVKGLLGTGDVNDVSAGPAVEAAKKVQAPAVIFGKVTERSTAGRRTRVAVALRAVKVDDGGTILAKAFNAQIRRSWTSPAYVGVWIRSRTWYGRVLMWMVIVALVPLATGRVAKPLLVQESNALNAAVLGVHTLIDVLAAWLMMGFGRGGAVLILVVLGAIAGGVYNYVIGERLAAAAE